MNDTLLIVDNEDSIVKCVALMFKKDFNILTASGGIEALEILKNKQVSCIISDYEMENGDGLFLIKNLSRREIPFILMTGRGEKDLFKDFANERAFHIYEKPIDTKIIAVVKRAIENFHQIQRQNKERLFGKNAGNILHDLNNGLAIVEMSATQGVANPSKNPDKNFTRILEGCKKINNMILKYKEFMNGNDNVTLTNINLTTFMNEMNEEFTLSVGGWLKIYTKNTLDQASIIVADEVFLRQVILNLVSNSLYEIKDQPNPTVKFNLYQEQGYVLIDIEDSGSIPDEVAENLFKEGFSTKQENGTGMGLIYCRTLLQKMNGTIRLSSTKPTTFSIRFKI